MHEMSLAEGVLRIIEENAKNGNYSRVLVVRLEIGALSHVEPEALRFCFDAVIRGSLADGARLEILETEGRGYCLGCGKEVTVAARYDPCPDCGAYQVQVTGGDELRVRDLEVE